ncbi:hypothetical protein [Virgibacillus sp. Bac330]|uniref:hypothetical protein n=1 Tax=Virgibacillus sp. Bac330 TaxID=2419841 RepID=UPI000EF51876|nr:hypothetical protein [Virgibacillus sp. Bac330]
MGVIGEFNFDYLARAMSQINPYTIVIEKSSGKQIYKHPEANELQYEVHHTKHGKLTTFSLLLAAKRYSNNWQNTVVIDKVTKKQMYARKDLGWYNYAVRNKKTGEPIASFHFLPNAEDFAKKYREGTVVIDNLND